MTATPNSLLPVALEAVAMASELVRTRLPGVMTLKGDRDMTSEVEFTAERTVRRYLSERTPEIAFLGEEEGGKGHSDDGLLWTLDPVDGTANFLRGLPLWGIVLGLVHNRRPIISVIDLPFFESRYTAVEGEGAYRGNHRIRVSGTTSLEDAVISIGDYAVGEDADRKNRLRLAVTRKLAAKAQRLRMLGTAAVDFAWVAEGRLDACIILSNNPWETAPGVLLAREAGATAFDKDGSPHTLDSTATIATVPALAEEVLSLVQQGRREAE